MKSSDRNQAIARVVSEFRRQGSQHNTENLARSRWRPPVPTVPLATRQSILLHPLSASIRAGTSIAQDWARRPSSPNDRDRRIFRSQLNIAVRARLRLHYQSEPSRDFLLLNIPAALLCMGAVLSIALAEPALAQTANIEGVLQNVTMLTGNVARLLATLAVIIVGIAWMFGYLDLRKAAYVVLGVAITFGASEVVSTLTGGH